MAGFEIKVAAELTAMDPAKQGASGRKSISGHGGRRSRPSEGLEPRWQKASDSVSRFSAVF